MFQPKLTIIKWLILIALTIPILATAWLGFQTRYHADDFCMAGLVIRNGFWQAANFWYQTWTGRYSYIFFTQLFGLGGSQLARVFPSLLLLLWFTLLSWFFYNLMRLITSEDQRYKAPHPFQGKLVSALTLSASTLYLILHLIPNLFQSVLWQNGSINYTLPLIFLMGSLAIILHVTCKIQTTSHLQNFLPFGVSVFVLSFISSGFTEVFVVMQLCLFSLLVTISCAWWRRYFQSNLVKLFSAGLAGALLGFIIVITAPGNIGRQASTHISNYPGLMKLLMNTTYLAYITGHSIIKHNGVILFIILCTCIWISYTYFITYATLSSSPRNRRWFWIMLLSAISLIPVSFGLVMVTMMPTEYYLHSYPDARTLIIPYFAVVMSVLLFGIILGYLLWVKRGFIKVNLLLAFSILLLFTVIIICSSTTRRITAQIPESIAFAQRWDQRDQYLHLAKVRGETEVSAPGLPIWNGVHDLALEPDNWVNTCMAWYYGFTKITGR